MEMSNRRRFKAFSIQPTEVDFQLLRIEDKTVIWRNWIEARILTLDQLIDDDDGFLTFQEEFKAIAALRMQIEKDA